MKKQALVTNQRDKNLLIILAAIICAYLCYNFIINPALEKGSLLSQGLSDAKIELARSNDVFDQYPTLKQEEHKKKQLLLDKYGMFFYDLNQERILYKLNALIVNSGFSVANYATAPTVASPITFPTPSYTKISYPLLDLASKSNPSLMLQEGSSTSAAAPEGTATQDSAAADSIPTTDITLGFMDTTYEATMGFLKSLENMDKSVIVRNISISKTENGIGGQIVLSLYSLPKLDDSEKDMLKFSPVIPQGKANPFN